jgi:hypothetical protein
MSSTQDYPPAIGDNPWGDDLNTYLAWLDSRLARIEDGTIGPQLPFNLSPFAAVHALVSDVVTLATTPPLGTLGVNNAVHVMTSDTPTLTTPPPTVWTLAPANAAHVMTSNTPALLPDGPVELTMEAGATTFQPWVQLQSGSTATITWKDTTGATIGTGSQPTITVPANRIVRMFVTQGGLPAMNEVDYFNIGFDNSQDAGRDSIGVAYNWPSQRVVQMAGTQLLTGMRYFMAAGTPLVTAFNFTGMSNLQFIECFGSEIQTAILTGCTSLIRFCVEGCQITYMDFSPVKNVLRDLRCAANGPGPVTLFSDGPMTQLVHYCTQGQDVAHHIPSALLPAIIEYWVYGTNITTIDPIISPAAASILMQSNPLTSATVDGMLIQANAMGLSGSAITYDMVDGAPPSATGQAARVALESRGCRIECPQFGTDGGGNGTLGTYTAPTHQPWVLANTHTTAGAFGTVNMVTSVTSGVLAATWDAWQMCLFNPTGHSTWENCYFEVVVDWAEIDNSYDWALMVNCDTNGRNGARLKVNWSVVNTGATWGVSAGKSDSYAFNTPGDCVRIAPNPAGWSNAGAHKFGIYHAGDTMYLTQDGAKTHFVRLPWVDWLGGGPYAGIGGYGISGKTYHFASWGYAPVTMP